jgi:uncharacterized membrane protein
MIDFLKKYRLNILTVLVLAGLLLFFIPNEESHYLQPDIDKIKNKSQSVLFWTELILFGVLFIFGLRQLKKITDFFYLIAGLGLFALTFFFFFDSVFLSSTFFLNKLSKSNTVDKTYNVVFIDQDKKSLLLWDNSLNESVQADRLLTQENRNLSLKLRDTVTVSFSKGLLGFNFDPKIELR